jgi:GDP-L-fucose synthase
MFTQLDDSNLDGLAIQKIAVVHPAQNELTPSNRGYAYSKRISGYQTKIFKQLTGNNWITVVPANVYGPHDNFHPDYSHIIPGIIQRAYNCKNNNEDFAV